MKSNQFGTEIVLLYGFISHIMKTNLSSILLFLFFCLPAYCKSEDISFVQGGIKYYVEMDSTVSISDVGVEVPLPISADSTLVIPSSVSHEGKIYLVEYIKPESFSLRLEIKHLVVSEGIERIGRRAFNGCLNLTDISIPSTLVFWDEDLFEFCSSLRSITVAEQNETYDSRDNCNAIIETGENKLVFGCTGTLIPASVTTIGQYAFNGCCQLLERIVIPEGVKRIERWAFSQCVNLKEISLPVSLEVMGYGIFQDCMSLESITIPQNVSNVSVDDWGFCRNLFSGCHNLREVKVDKRNHIFDSRNNCNAIIHSKTDAVVAGCGASFIPEGIKAVGNFAFEGSSLPAIRIPKSVRKIGRGAFFYCQFLSTISVASGNPVYNSKDDCNAIIETAAAKLVQGCSRTVIPSGTKEIADSAFLAVNLPPWLVIPEGIEVIGVEAFLACKQNFVQLPSTLKRIKKDAFASCKRLYYVDMSRCNPQVDSWAFYGCESLNFVNMSSTPSMIDEDAFLRTPFEKLWKDGMKHSK